MSEEKTDSGLASRSAPGWGPEQVPGTELAREPGLEPEMGPATGPEMEPYLEPATEPELGPGLASETEPEREIGWEPHSVSRLGRAWEPHWVIRSEPCWAIEKELEMETDLAPGWVPDLAIEMALPREMGSEDRPSE